MAVALLIATEKRLGKDKSIGRLYDEQMKDMIDRGAARKMTKVEVEQYTGPVQYIMHRHEVIKAVLRLAELSSIHQRIVMVTF